MAGVLYSLATTKSLKNIQENINHGQSKNSNQIIEIVNNGSETKMKTCSGINPKVKIRIPIMKRSKSHTEKSR